MEVDTCYLTPEDKEFQYIKRYITVGGCKIAIIGASDQLYVNKKNVYTTLDVLNKDGYVAVQARSLADLHRILAVGDCDSNLHLDVVIFTNENIGGRSGTCFYDCTVPFVFFYKERRPMCWLLNNSKNLYESRPNVFHCEPDEVIRGINHKGLEGGRSHQITAKLLEPTNVQDTILLIGWHPARHVEYIKNLCRHVVIITNDFHDAYTEIEEQGIRIVKTW